MCVEIHMLLLQFIGNYLKFSENNIIINKRAIILIEKRKKEMNIERRKRKQNACHEKGFGKLINSLLLVFCGLFLLQSIPYVAQAEEQKVVKVGVFEIPGFCEFDFMGNLMGYEYEYLCLLAEVTGWEYEFIDVGTFVDGRKLLEQEKIDLLAPALQYEEDKDKFVFSNYSLGKEYTVLITQHDNARYGFEDYDSFEGMSVGVVTDLAKTEKYETFRKAQGFETQQIQYGSEKEVLAAVKAGEVDAGVVNLMYVDANYKVLARFDQSPFYFVLNKNNQVLHKELDAAMQRIQMTNANFLNNLSQEYFPIYDTQYLTGEQRDFIATQDSINIGYVEENIPLSYTDQETGEFCGIIRDVLDIIQELSGLTFHYVALPEGNIDYAFLKEHNLQIVSGVSYNRWNKHAKKMTITQPFAEGNRIIIAKNNFIFDKNASSKLAMCTGSQTISNVLTEQFPNFEYQNYKTIEQCFRAVLTGQADVMILNEYVANYWMSRPSYEGLSIVPIEGLADEQCLAIMQFEDGKQEECLMIRDILNVAISQLSEEEVNAIIMNEIMQHQYQYTAQDFLYRYRYAISLGVLLVVVIIVVLLSALWIRERHNKDLLEKEHRLFIQQKRYELLLEKSKDIIFDIDLETGQRVAAEHMKHLFGWTIDGLTIGDISKAPVDYWEVYPEDQEKLETAFYQVIENKKPSECVVRLRQHDKGYVWCRIYRYPIMNQDEEVVKVIGKLVDIDLEEREAERLRKQNRTDSMTGLLNKNTFLREIREYLYKDDAYTDEKEFCMVFVDLDHFKTVNDTLGHLTGDEAIMEAAGKLQKIFANSDYISRFGGDEFCLFLKNISVEKVQEKLEHTRISLQREYQKENLTVKITASIGALYCHKNELPLETLIEKADDAVYRSKEDGRDRVTLVEV